MLSWVMSIQRAAKRRQSVAPGVSPGLVKEGKVSPVGATDESALQLFLSPTKAALNLYKDSDPRAHARGYTLPPSPMAP
jgi:hypothetical protein